MNVDEVLQRAMSAYGTGNLGQAELPFNQVLGADKHRFDALHMLGILQSRRRNYAEAVRLITRAIEVQPQPIVLERTLADLVTGDDVFLDVDPALAVVADPLVIERVVTNLIANARQHGKPPVHIHAEARDRHVRITVTDAGAGVPENLVPRLFERFEHGGTSGGTGLGLAIAKAYANAHGGDLYYEPGPWGTRFDLVLPRG